MNDELSDHDAAAIRAIGLGPDNAGRTFKVGQKWKDEVGGVVTITTLTGAIHTFPMEATNQDGKTSHYTSEGRYFDDRGSVYDLTILVADVDDTRCVDDGGICGVGGFCDDCPHVNHEIIPDKLSDHALDRIANDLKPLHLTDAERRRPRMVVDGAALRNLVYLALSAQALLERNGDELSNRTVRDIDNAIAGIRERCEIWRG